MDEAEARSLLEETLAELRKAGYQDLADRYLGDVATREVIGASGAVYQVEIEVFWDDPRRPGDNLRVMAAIDDGRGWRSLAPLTSGFIIAPTGGVVGE